MLSSIDSHQSVQARIKKNASLFGNKAANLIELDTLSKTIKSDFIHIQIPQIIPISHTTIETHLTTYAPEWKKTFDKFIHEQNSNKKLTVESKKIVKKLQKIITQCFHEHPFTSSDIASMQLPKDTLFMLRSTGEEDTKEMANPGGNKSIAAVKWDTQAISDAIGTVVASYVSNKSLKQRLLSGDDITKPPFMPVLLQTMIGEKLNGEKDLQNIIVSGVMYAKGALTRIEAAPGHGELIVNSKAPFDIYDVTQNRVVHAEIHQKTGRLIPIQMDNGKRKLVFVDNPKILRDTTSLEPDIAKEIAMVGEKIQSHYCLPIDIEFVYHPKEKMLSIVQARPIPEAQKKISPSSISPELWLQLKNDPRVDKIKSQVITPAARAAKIITDPNQIIVMSTLGDALKKYLSDDKNQENIRAIVVKEEAPSTSHEAAIFNALSIPVMQGDTETLQTWLKDRNLGIIVDIQHQHIVNIKKYLKDPSDVNNEILEQKMIIEGLFSSVLSPKKTLLFFSSEPEKVISDTIKTYLAKPVDTIQTKFIYHKLLDDIQLLETSKPNKENKVSFEALKNIADIFRRMGTGTNAKDTHNPHKALFSHAMLTIADIHLCLESYRRIGENSDAQIKKRQELLDLISKLNALIVNSGEEGLFSDSVLQIAMRHKAENQLYLKDEKLSKKNQEIAIELLKMGNLALNEKTKKSWKKFVLGISTKKYTQQMLAKIVLFCYQNNIQSELINNYFIQSYEKSEKNTLLNLYTEIDKTENLFNKLKIKDIRRTIASFEKRIPEWSNPSKYTKLYEDLKEEFIPLIEKLNQSYTDDIPTMGKTAILRQIQLFADVFDKTIKSLKGSPEYKNKPTSVLIERFYDLLTPYHQLMHDWMIKIPEHVYKDCAEKIIDNGYNSKNKMIDVIKETFNNKKNIKEEKQLHPSGKFSVASAKVGGTTSFYRQMVYYKDYLTLEDLFTLFHQNILESTNILGKKIGIHTKLEHLPQPLIPLIKAIEKIEDIQLLNISREPSTLQFIFNLPLKNHSTEIGINYNLKTGMIDVNWKFFGGNWDNRMDYIAFISILDCFAIGGFVTKIPKPDTNYYGNMEFQWHFKKNQIDVLIKSLSLFVKTYGDYTEERSTIKAVQNYFRRNTAAESPKLLEKIPYDIRTELYKLIQTACDTNVALKIPEIIFLYDELMMKKVFSRCAETDNLFFLKELLNLLPKEQFKNPFYQKKLGADVLVIVAKIENSKILKFLLDMDKENLLRHMKNSEGVSYEDLKIHSEFKKALEEYDYVNIKKMFKDRDNTFFTTPFKNILGDHYLSVIKNNMFEKLKEFMNILPNDITQKIFLYHDYSVYQDNAITWAAFEKSYDILDWLIEQDKDCRLRAHQNNRKQDYLYFIRQNIKDHIKNNQFKLIARNIKYIVSSEDPGLESIKEAFLSYAKEGDLELLEKIAQVIPENFFESIFLHCDKNGDSALSWAAYNSHQTVVDWLLKRDTQNKLKNLKNIKGEDYLTPHYGIKLIKLAKDKNYSELLSALNALNQNSIMPNFEHKETGQSFKSILHEQALQYVENNDMKSFETFTKHFSNDLSEKIFRTKNGHTLLTKAASKGNIEIIDFCLKNFPSLISIKDESRNDYLQNLSIHLINLAKNKKYDEMSTLIQKYKNIPLDYEYDNNDSLSSDSVISVVGKQLIEYMSKEKIDELSNFNQLFKIKDFPQFYQYKDEMNNTLLIWSAYAGYEDWFDALLALDKDKKIRYEKSKYGYDAIENLSLFLILVTRHANYWKLGHYLKKYNDISFDVDDKKTPSATLKSALCEQLMKHIKENDIAKLDALYDTIPQNIFKDLLIYKEKDETTTLLDKTKKENLAPPVLQWLENHNKKPIISINISNIFKQKTDSVEPKTPVSPSKKNVK